MSILHIKLLKKQYKYLLSAMYYIMKFCKNLTLIHNHITIYNTFRRSWKIYTFKISPLLSASFFQLNIQIQKTQLDNPLCIKSRVAEWKNGSQYMCADRSCYNRNFKQGLPYMWSRCENKMLSIVIIFHYGGFEWYNTYRQMVWKMIVL